MPTSLFEGKEYLCEVCNGSGEGQMDGTICYACKGTGVEGTEEEIENDEYDDDEDTFI